jgi:hypothetical protein
VTRFPTRWLLLLAAVASPTAAGAGEREDMLGPFLARHWRLPVPEQGPPPEGFTAQESGLDPASCGSCHPQQYLDWQTTLHAGAYSPGFAGQLIEGPLAERQERDACLTCHSPLAEQQRDAALRAQGVVCAACHVRRRRTFGPARRADAPPAPTPVPHDGFEVRAEYQQARFCAECHQFFDGAAPGGKPIQNTFVEWQASPQAARGETCQSCHMPDRAHRWRGIHDPDTVRAAVDVALAPAGAGLDGPGLQAALLVSNRAVGHRFPTYITPRVRVAMWQEDAAGRALPGTREEAWIARVLDFSDWSEISDTRIPPGESVKLDYDRPRAAGAAALVGRVTVDPDYHYRGVFQELLQTYSDEAALARMRQALERASATVYVLRELRLPLP